MNRPQYELVTPEKTYGPFNHEHEAADVAISLGLDPEQQDTEGGWDIQIAGVTPRS